MRAGPSIVVVVGAFALATGCSSAALAPGGVEDAGAPDALLADALPAPILLASGQNAVRSVALDATSLYWASPLDGNVMKVPLGGGAAVALATGQTQPSAIAVDRASVYWANGDGTVWRAALDGSGATALATLGEPDPDVALAVSPASVYVTSHAGGAILAVPLGGGAPATIVSGEPRPHAVAVDATSIYWATLDCPTDAGACTGAIRKAPLAGATDGGAATTLAPAQVVSLVVDAANVYWTNAASQGSGGADGAVMSVPLTGGSPTTLASGQNDPYGIAVDAANVYWTTQGGAVASVPLGGGTSTVLASGQLFPLAVAVDATSLYWTDRGTGANGSVLKLTPK